jgi:uncharacterized protein
MPYVSSEDVDATTARAKELGATALMEPYDLENVGRLSMLVDPTGATFGLLKPSAEMTSQG